MFENAGLRSKCLFEKTNRQRTLPANQPPTENTEKRSLSRLQSDCLLSITEQMETGGRGTMTISQLTVTDGLYIDPLAPGLHISTVLHH